MENLKTLFRSSNLPRACERISSKFTGNLVARHHKWSPTLLYGEILLNNEKDVRLTAVGFTTISNQTDKLRPEVTSPIINLRADLIPESSWRRLSSHASELGMGSRPHGGPETGRRRKSVSWRGKWDV